MGWSNGATMTYRLVCEMSDRIAAAAPFSGTFNIKNPFLKDCEDLTDFKGFAFVWNNLNCGYRTWEKFDDFYECDLKKEVPLLIMNAEKDPLIPPTGVLDSSAIFANAPFYFGPRYFREKYNCNPNKLE